MPYTFECGTCNSVYRLDEHQITKEGVKITCPKCLTFFVLKVGSRTLDKPVVEYLVKDGEHEVQAPIETPPPEPSNKPPSPPPKKNVFDVPKEPSIGEAIVSVPKKASVPIGLKSHDSKPSFEAPPRPTATTPFKPQIQFSHRDLGEYPPEPAPPSKVLTNYIMPAGIVAVCLMTILILGLIGVLNIPGISPKIAPADGPATITPETSTQEAPKYGFPEVETDYDPWAESR